MLTGRRIRERQAAERAGLPPPAPPRPAEISRHEHEAAISALQNAHAEEVAKLRAEIRRLAAAGAVAVLPVTAEAEIIEPSGPPEATAEPEPEGEASKESAEAPPEPPAPKRSKRS